MANGFFNGFSDIFGPLPSFSELLGAGTQIAVQALAPQPAAVPWMLPTSPAQGIRTSAAAAPVIQLGGRMLSLVAARTREILTAIATNKGLLTAPSLASVIAFARKAAPIIGQGAVAAGLAITAEELAHLIFDHATRKRRRMNPGNVKALRRSMRRVESFHKLCVRADRLRGPRRRTAKGGAAAAQFVRQG